MLFVLMLSLLAAFAAAAIFFSKAAARQFEQQVDADGKIDRPDAGNPGSEREQALFFSGGMARGSAVGNGSTLLFCFLPPEKLLGVSDTNARPRTSGGTQSLAKP